MTLNTVCGFRGCDCIYNISSLISTVNSSHDDQSGGQNGAASRQLPVCTERDQKTRKDEKQHSSGDDALCKEMPSARPSVDKLLSVIESQKKK